MPEVGLASIVHVSSEDKVHKAVGLLKGNGLHKWQCAEPGEQQAVVIIQLRTQVKITKLHIGNEHSAFIEVLVGRSPADSDSDYSVLVPASAFMSPTESKTHSQPNRVRMFDTTTLCAQTATQKWDRLKVVCTQPFNRQVQYGVSFIRVFTDEIQSDAELSSSNANEQATSATTNQSNSAESSSPKRSQTTGSLKLRNEDNLARATPSAEDDLKPGQLFYAAQQRRNDDDKSSMSDDEDQKKRKIDVADNLNSGQTPPKRGRPSAPASATVSKPPRETKKAAEKDAKAKPLPPVKSKADVPKTTAADAKNASSDSADTKAKPRSRQQKDDAAAASTQRRSSTTAKQSAAKKNVPFNMLMKNVVFVLSGFENPRRGELRDCALEMGAKYKPDWTGDSTHLICAFPNTPKFKQVAGKGRIVKHEWILDCYKQKQLLEWRAYRLGRAPSPAGSHKSSDDEDGDEEDEDEEEEAISQKNDADDGSVASSDLFSGLPSLPSPIFRGHTFIIDTDSLSNGSSNTKDYDQKRFVHDTRRIVVAYGGTFIEPSSPKRTNGAADYAVLPDAVYESDAAKKEASKRHGRSIKLVSLDWLKRCADSGSLVSDSESL